MKGGVGGEEGGRRPPGKLTGWGELEELDPSPAPYLQTTMFWPPVGTE